MPVGVVSTRDQQAYTVNALVSAPLSVPQMILKLLDRQFVMDQILRSAGTPTGGAVRYWTSNPLFPDRPSEVIAEGAEIPVITATRGDLTTKPTAKHGLGVVITEEMKNRDDVGEVERQLITLKNALIRDIDGQFLTALRAAVTQTRAATAPWATSATATIRRDINAARKIIRTTQAPNAAGSYMGFTPDILLLGPDAETDLLNSPEFIALLYGQVNPSNIGELPPGILTLQPMVSLSVPAGEAWVMQSKIVGGYADEVPLQATALYYHQPTQTWRSDTTRTTVGFIDEPQAACRITGC